MQHVEGYCERNTEPEHERWIWTNCPPYRSPILYRWELIHILKAFPYFPLTGFSDKPIRSLQVKERNVSVDDVSAMIDLGASPYSTDDQVRTEVTNQGHYFTAIAGLEVAGTYTSCIYYLFTSIHPHSAMKTSY